MKVLFFTDLHGSPSAFKKLKKKAKNVDLIVNGGDFTIFEMEIEEIMKKLDSLGKPQLVIPGNHEDEDVVEHLCRQSNNLIYINESYYATDDFVIIAAEGNGFMIEDPRFKKLVPKLKRMVKKHKDKKYILLTHAPPYNTKLDIIIDQHCGNNTIRKFIEQTKPSYAFSGHLHENNYKKDKLGKTILWNPGPEGRILDI